MPEKNISREREDEWFVRHERELIEKARREREQRLKRQAELEQARERERLKELHWMRCPKCGHEMKEIELKGVHIDECTYCEGIFFDRGEFEELLLKNSQQRTGIFRRLLGMR